MSKQTRASFQKETLAFFRKGTFFIIAAVILGLSAFSPLLYTGMASLLDIFNETGIYDEMGVDIGNMTDFLSSTSSIGITSTISDISSVGLIVFLLLINSAAGGEQKKRNVIIPQTSGLGSFSYLFPKYIIYPLAAFCLTVLALLLSWVVSTAVFDISDVTLGQAALAGVLTGAGIMFYVCFHITLGTATGKAGMSAAVCISASLILPGVFSASGSNSLFNPFSMSSLATTVVYQPELSGAETRDIIITIIFAIALAVASFYIALFAQNAKRIDNRGNEIEL